MAANAYSRALRYLTARDRTIKEVRDYLTGKNHSDQEIDQAVDRLCQVNLLDDNKTAAHWVDYWLRCKPRGRDRMALDLRRRGVAQQIISEVLVPITDEVEYQMALELLRRRPVQDWPQGKLYRFLRYRGFSFAVIEKVALYYKNLT